MVGQRGFTYLGLLFAIALAGVALAATGTVWSFERQRQREVELLFIGQQFRDAIASYYEHSPGLVKRYPAKLEDLLKDNRFLTVQRHLRRIYRDPMTGLRQWQIVPAPEGGVMGVFSGSAAEAIKHAGFPPGLSDLEGTTNYAEWKFVYRPQTGGQPMTPQLGIE
ncbi:MAG: type II secretion system protein [Rhodocyclaceae bacterium]|nr:type II secretion system protein [Rhodocyclaceae bacterium]